MSQFKTKRLSKDENKSNNSYQNNLSPDEIKEKLEEYKRVDDISTVSLNAHLRYFIVNEKTGEKQFRLGGFLTKIDKQKGYVVLSNGNLSWSVQLKNSIFFKKMSFQELKQELIEDVSKLYSSEISKLKKENKKLKEALKEIKNQAEKSKKDSKKSSKNKN
jgi:hypothetical protein|tara:strand:+ start:141 stop:623 length:483 start_codon:yes stop_codon:yes gene_type:complete